MYSIKTHKHRSNMKLQGRIFQNHTISQQRPPKSHHGRRLENVGDIIVTNRALNMAYTLAEITESKQRSVREGEKM